MRKGVELEWKELELEFDLELELELDWKVLEVKRNHYDQSLFHLPLCHLRNQQKQVE